MLLPLSNLPRDYAWGSTTLIAELEGREPTGAREAEVWFGDHPGCPAKTPDGRTLDRWLREEGAASGAPDCLPYLLKVLAAASPLSIQSHPSKAQAHAGFEREEAVGVPVDAPHRVFRDDNHKPELIVAVSDTFTALAGVRDLAATRRLLAELGEAGRAISQRLEGDSDAAAVRDTIAWLLSGEASAEVEAVVAAASVTASDEFAGELGFIRRFGAEFPGDPGLVVALLMNLVTLRRGEALFVDAGVLHAYVEGLGVEVMAASDNVLRGGLTPKHIDVPGLLEVLDPTPGPAPVLEPRAVGSGVDLYAPGVPDFALVRARVANGADASVALRGTAIALVVAGPVTVADPATGDSVILDAGRAVLAAGVDRLVLSGSGEVFIAEPGE